MFLVCIGVLWLFDFFVSALLTLGHDVLLLDELLNLAVAVIDLEQVQHSRPCVAAHPAIGLAAFTYSDFHNI